MGDLGEGGKRYMEPVPFSNPMCMLRLPTGSYYVVITFLPQPVITIAMTSFIIIPARKLVT